MKKAMGIVAAVLIVLVAVGAVAGGDSESDTSVATNQHEELKEEKKEQEKNTFNGKKLVLDDYTIKITDYKVIQPGEKGNEYGEKKFKIKGK